MTDYQQNIADQFQQEFDPEGGEYDYNAAKRGGLSADETGHWPSRDPGTGRILKGRNHPTFDKTIKGEEEAGYEIYKASDGYYYSRKRGN